MNKVAIFITVFFLGITLNGYSQEKVVIKKRHFKTEQKEGLKDAWKSIKEGDKYYDQGLGTFPIARDHYLFANQYNDSCAKLNYKIGICYLYSDDKLQAIDYLKKAFEIDPNVSYEVRFLLGRAHHLVLEFDKAREYYLEYRSSLGDDDDKASLYAHLDKLIVECAHGKGLVKEPKRVIIENLGSAVNSVYDEYNPIFAYQDSVLYFTSRRAPEKKGKRSEVDNKYMEDIYSSKVNANSFNQARALGKPFVSKGNVSLIEVAPDGAYVLIYKGDEEGGDIQQVMWNEEKGKWKKAKSLSKYIGSDASETTAALSPDGKELFFISNDPEKTVGGKDIFLSKMNSKGKWEDPVNLGSLLNTKYDEEGVFLSEDGNTLYFASQGHTSMGGFDIFTSERGENGQWQVPKNIGYPINTPDDEVFYVSDKEHVFGYYSTVREGGYGGKDIYKVIYLGSEKELLTMTSEDLFARAAYLELSPLRTMPELIEIDTSLFITGVIKDTVGGVDTTIVATLNFISPETGEIAARGMSGKDGVYRTKLPNSGVYGIEINSPGYLYYLDILDLSGLNPDEPAKRDFYMQRIEVGTKVVLDNIYFQTGKSVLTSESYEALNNVAKFLKDNETVRLEISGHTDNTGSLRINTNLSKARAKAVVDYIVGQGVGKDRLEYEGYADSQPVAPNDTPEGREKNRRVEFKVLSK